MTDVNISIRLETRRHCADYITRAIMTGNIGKRVINTEVGNIEFTNSYITNLNIYGYKMILSFRECSTPLDKLDTAILELSKKMIETSMDIKAFSNTILSDESLKQFDYEYEVI